MTAVPGTYLCRDDVQQRVFAQSCRDPRVAPNAYETGSERALAPTAPMLLPHSQAGHFDPAGVAAIDLVNLHIAYMHRQ